LQFLQRYHYKIRKAPERKRLLEQTFLWDEKINVLKKQVPNWNERLAIAKQLRINSVENMGELLMQFEQKVKDKKTIVYWAETAKEATEKVATLIQRAEAKSTFVFEAPELFEIKLNRQLKRKGIPFNNISIGDWVRQQANEIPAHGQHLLMDKTGLGIKNFIKEELGGKKEFDVNFIKKKILKYPQFPSVSITGANFLLADNGQMYLSDNEGASHWSWSSTNINIVIAGIDRITASTGKLMDSLPVFNAMRYGQIENAFNTWINGPADKDEMDGPGQVYLILLDNGRSDLLANPILKNALIDLDGWFNWMERTWAYFPSKKDFPTIQCNHINQYDKGDVFFHPLSADVSGMNLFGIDYEAIWLEKRKVIMEKSIHQNKEDIEWINTIEQFSENPQTMVKNRSGLKAMMLKRKWKKQFPLTSNIPSMAPQTFSEWWKSRK